MKPISRRRLANWPDQPASWQRTSHVNSQHVGGAHSRNGAIHFVLTRGTGDAFAHGRRGGRQTKSLKEGSMLSSYGC